MVPLFNHLVTQRLNVGRGKRNKTRMRNNIVIDDGIVSQSLGEDEEQEIDIVNVYRDV